MFIKMVSFSNLQSTKIPTNNAHPVVHLLISGFHNVEGKGTFITCARLYHIKA